MENDLLNKLINKSIGETLESMEAWGATQYQKNTIRRHFRYLQRDLEGLSNLGNAIGGVDYGAGKKY
jgi:hypothetical protein